MCGDGGRERVSSSDGGQAIACGGQADPAHANPVRQPAVRRSHAVLALRVCFHALWAARAVGDEDDSEHALE